jgi:nicotinamidase/pyrazinamidase
VQGPFVFVDVDTQRDFLEPAGALFVAGSGAILPNLARLTACARDRGIPVLATACAHTPDEPDPEPFPAHCLVGTRGQQRVEATVLARGRVVGPDEPWAGELPGHLTLQKRRYDVFSHPDAGRIVALYGRDGPTFVVYGVATDYCVRAAVLGLRDRGHRAAVVVDAVRAVDARARPTS